MNQQRFGTLDLDRALVEAQEREKFQAERVANSLDLWERAKREHEEATKLVSALRLVANNKHLCVPVPRDS